MWNRVKLLCIVSWIFDATPGKAQIMNEMRLYAGFMNGVTSLFVPNLCSEQNDKVSGDLAPPTMRTIQAIQIVEKTQKNRTLF